MSDRETIDLFLGHPDYRGEERSDVEGVDRFVVSVVYRDGVPRDLSRHDLLEDALAERDREAAAHLIDGLELGSFRLSVLDREEPGRGELDYDDLEGG